MGDKQEKSPQDGEAPGNKADLQYYLLSAVWTD